MSLSFNAPFGLPRSGDWWPGGLGHPNHVGARPGWRFAFFARAQRLVIEHGGEVLLLDTLGHEILKAVVGEDGMLRFDSPGGPVDLASLPVIGRGTTLW
ncbi:MAG TPA: hypothetical protein VNU71_00780 [Burkholderiaceae bacterium]|nr:hypothetical protein [Burkholderiaceae bacterium]